MTEGRGQTRQGKRIGKGQGVENREAKKHICDMV